MQPIPKYQNTVTGHGRKDHNVCKGMTTGDIAEAHLKELYDLDISDSTISRITDKIMPLVKNGRSGATGDICCCLHGCDPLPRPQRRAYCETCGIHCPWDRYGWEKGCDRHVCWGK